MPPFLRRRIAWLLVVAFGLASFAVVQARNWMKSREYDSLIAEAAVRYAVDPKLLKAIVWKASGFDARKNSEGAYGLMQLGKGTGIEWAAVTGVEARVGRKDRPNQEK